MEPSQSKQNPSDGELLDAARNGNQEAADELCQKHNYVLLALIVGVLRHGCSQPRDHAEDVKNDVWLNIFRYLPTLRENDKFPAWRDQIARHTAYSHLRKCIPTYDKLVSLDDQISLPDGGIASTQEVLEAAEEVNILLERAERISPKLALIMRLLYLEGYSWDEISARLGEKKETLRTFFNRGLIKLRNKSGGRGG